MDKQNNELLRFQNVDICYGENLITQDINLTLHQGEILALVGESGSGKTTILKAAMGILDNGGLVTKGDIYFHGQNIPDLSEEDLRQIRGAHISMIFQDSGASFCPIRTIGEQIFESINEHQPADANTIKNNTLAIFDALHFVDSERVYNSYPFELSGGMNQRVGIAQALVQQPDIILADEPTSALDVVSQREVIKEMLAIRDTYGTAFIVVTHDLSFASAVADTIMVLKNGHMEEYGPAEQILHNPKAAYTQALLKAVPRLKLTKDGESYE